MKISIITATYNSAATVADTLECIKSQDYPDIEHVIIDGGSTDSTLSIVRNYGHVSSLSTGPDDGIYDAMNKGLAVASGEVIGILNSDDIYVDQYVISDVMDRFKSDPSLDILYGDLEYVRNGDFNNVVRRWKSLPYYDNYFEHGNVPPHPSLFLRRNVYRISGKFNLRYKLAADYEFMLRIFKKHNFKSLYINRLIVKMRLGGATNKNSTNVINGNKEIISAWKINDLKPPITLMPRRLIKRLLQFI